MPRSRSFTRLTMRVGLLHLGQSVGFVVSSSFLRSPVFAILAIGGVFLLLGLSLHTSAAPGSPATGHCRWGGGADGFNGAVLKSPAQLALFLGRILPLGERDSLLQVYNKSDRACLD